MNRSGATIRDVAAHAACSIATVSRVITGRGPVSEAMRARVEASAAAPGFSRVPVAKPHEDVIGVLVPSLANPVFADAVAGIEHCAGRHGLSTVMVQSNYDTAREDSVVAALIARRPRGLILTVCDKRTSLTLARRARRGLPVATLYNGAGSGCISSVSVDSRGAIARLVRRLIDLGHRRIQFVGGRFDSSDRSAARYAGYCDALRAAGLRPLPACEVDFIDAVHDIDLTAVMARQRPSAIVASNDLLAITVIADVTFIAGETVAPPAVQRPPSSTSSNRVRPS